MKHKIVWTLIGIMAVTALVLAACAPPSNGNGNGGNGATEPQYGGTQTYRSTAGGVQGFDPMHWLNNGMLCSILDRWYSADWMKGPAGTGQYDYNVSWMPQSMLQGELLESWETIDEYHVNWKIREGIHYWDKPPVNGRELTTDDITWNWYRHVYHPRSDGWMASTPEASLQWWENYLQEIEDGLQPEQPLIDHLALLREYGPEVEEQFYGIEGYDGLEDYLRDEFGSSYDLLNDAGYDVSDGLILMGGLLIKIDDYNLEYHTARCGQSWGSLQGTWPTPREVTEVDDFSDWETVVGTGPWIPTYHDPSTGVSFERNPDYWQNDPGHPENQLPYTDEVHILMITDEAAFHAALQTAQLDSGYVEYYKVDFFKDNYPEMVETEPGNTSTFLFHLRNDVPPFDDVRVRWAASMAVDQEALFNDRYKGKANFVSWPQQPWNTVVYQPLEDYDQIVQDCFGYDPERAIELLSEAGYPLGFETQIFVGPSAEGQEVAQIVQSWWADVGIDAELNNMDETTLISHLWFKTYEHAIVSIWENDRPDDALNWCEGGVASTPYNFSMVDDPQNVLTSMEIACILDDDTYYARIKEDDIRRMNNMNHLILPTAVSSTFTWPWLNNHYGVTDMGPPDNSYSRELHKYRWIDQDLKASMGY